MNTLLSLMKISDYILFKIVVFFKLKNIGFVWIATYWVVNYGYYTYEVYNQLEVKLYWYDLLTIIIFVITYFRAKWIILKLKEHINDIEEKDETK